MKDKGKGKATVLSKLEASQLERDKQEVAREAKALAADKRTGCSKALHGYCCQF